MIDERRFTKAPVKDISQNIILENRRKLNVSGVEDVDSFDEDSVVLFTEAGTLIVKGQELHINKLSVETGDVIIDGDIISLTYTDSEKGKKGNFFTGLFR